MQMSKTALSASYFTLWGTVCALERFRRKRAENGRFFIFLCRNYFLPRFACFSFLISWYRFSFPTVNLQYEMRKSEIMEGFQNHKKGKKRPEINSAHKIN